jgi:hypothetical protein
MDARDYLALYDAQLRTEAETAGATEVARLGPLWLAVFPGGRGFVTHRDLAGADTATLDGWVGRAVEHFGRLAGVDAVEWKTRGHDRAPGLHDALLGHGFVAEEAESVMVGEAALLDVEVPLPAGVRLRRVHEEADVRAMGAMQDLVFGSTVGSDAVGALLERLARDDGVELWVAEADGRVVSAGRLEPVAGTLFAGIWGGATVPAWRGRGIYRALTAARARSALRMGKTLIHSDSTEHSRPILERSGLVRVSTTTPYVWRR